jgi:hypothetical protein
VFNLKTDSSVALLLQNDKLKASKPALSNAKG